MLEYLNQHVVHIKLVVAVLTLLATLILLYLNRRANKIAKKAVMQMQLAREEEFRPYVLFDLVFDKTSMSFVVKNSGKSAAYNIKLSINNDLKVWNALVGDEEYHPSDMAITNEIDMLAPGDNFTEWLDYMYIFFRNNKEKKVIGNLTYKDQDGKAYEFPIDINLAVFEKRGQIIHKGMGDLVKSAENIVRKFEQIW